MSDPIIDRVESMRAKGFDMSKLPDDVKAYIRQKAAEEAQGSASSDEDNLPVVQEQHPSISFADRFKIKNFGDDAMASIAYLKSEHPEVDFSTRKGQIVAKAPGEKDWRVLDPSSFDIQDITDLTYDVLGGIGQGAATAGAAVLGGGFSAGAGAIPAAMAAGGATGVGIEAARQGIGKWMGVNDFDKTNLAISGGIGLAAPLAFGTGATKSALSGALKGYSDDAVKALSLKGGNFVSKAVVPDALAKETAQSVLEKANKGILSNPASKLGSFLSGIPRRVLEKMHEQVSPEVRAFLSKAYEIDPEKSLSHLQAAEIIQAQKPGELANQFVDTVNEMVQSKREEVGAKIGRAIDNSNVQFDIPAIRRPIDELIASLGVPETDAEKQIFSTVTALRDKFFTKKILVQEVSEDGESVLGKLAGGLDDEAIAKLPESQRNLIMEALAAEKEAAKPVEKIVEVQNLNGKKAAQLRDMLADMVRMGKDNSSDAIGKNNSRMVAAFNEARNNLSKDIYSNIENGHALKNLYRENEELSRGLATKFGTPDAALKTMKNIDNKTYVIVKENLDKFDKMHGTKLGELNDVVQTWNIFANADSTTKFGRGSEIARRAMGAGGLLAGGLAQAAGLPMNAVGPIGLAGGIAGQTLTSPSAIKTMGKFGAIKNTAPGKLTQTVINKLSGTSPALRGGNIVPSAWMLMNKRGEK